MYEGEIDPRYHAYYRKAHEERAKAFRDAMSWLFGRSHGAAPTARKGSQTA